MSKWFFLRYFLLIWCYTTTVSYSQIIKIPFRSGDLWGYADQQGNVITPPKYDSVDFRPHWFGEKCHFVYKNNKKGLVNAIGKEFIAPNYSMIEWNKKISYQSDYFAPTILKGYSVVEDGSIGFIDMKGRIRLAAVYDQIISYTYLAEKQRYVFLVKDEDHYKIIDSEAKIKARRIDSINETSIKNCYQLRIGSQYGIYDLESNKWLAIPQYDTIRRLETYNLRDGLIHKNYRYGMLYKNHYYTTDRYYNITDSIPKEQLSSLYGAKNPPPPPPPPPPPLEQDPDIFMIIEDPIRGSVLSLDTISSLQASKKQTPIDSTNIVYQKRGKKLSIWYYNAKRRKKIKGLCDTIITFQTKYSLKKSYHYVEKMHKNTLLAIMQKGKWGIYLPQKNQWLHLPTLDSIRFKKPSKEYRDPHLTTQTIRLYQDGKVGLIACNDLGKIVCISPEYGQYQHVEFVWEQNNGVDRTRKRFYCYVFNKEGRKYIVGENNVVFAQKKE